MPRFWLDGITLSRPPGQAGVPGVRRLRPATLLRGPAGPARALRRHASDALAAVAGLWWRGIAHLDTARPGKARLGKAREPRVHPRERCCRDQPNEPVLVFSIEDPGGARSRSVSFAV